MEILILAAVYFGAAEVGLMFAAPNPNVSPVWPPSGIAIGALLLLGSRAWPGVFLGAFLANALTPVPLLTTFGIATGNTLEAVAAVVLLQSLNFHRALDRARDVGAFMAVVFVATMVSATIGNVTLALTNSAKWAEFYPLWMTWWLGDLVGTLVIGPLLLAWGTKSDHWLPKRRSIEAVLLLSVLGLAAMVTFAKSAPTPIQYYPLTRMIVPFFLWVSLRLGQRGTTLATVVLSAFAIWGTAHDVGPFVGLGRTPAEALLQLQLFVGSNAITFLFLAAVVQERRTAAQALRRNEQQLSVALDAAKMGAWSYDLNTTKVQWSPNLEAMHGVEPGSFGGTFEHFLRDIHPDDRQQVIASISKNVDKGTLHEIEYRIIRPDNSIRWVEGKGQVIRDEKDNAIRMTGVCMDVTERKHSEQEREELLIREQNARIEAERATETIKRLQSVTDTALQHLAVDELLNELLVRVREVLEVDSVAILLLSKDGTHLALSAGVGLEKELATEEIRIPVGRGIAGTIAQRRELMVFEDLTQADVYNPILRDNISSLIGAPLVIKGKVVGVIHADTIRPRKFSDEDITLLQLVADRTALAIDHAHLYQAEQTARIAAEDASRMKDEFLATVSHELRTPLNAIVGWSGMLRTGRLDQPTSKRAMEIIDRNARAQTQLIDDMLDVSRIITGKLRVDVAPVELPQVMEAAIDSIRPAVNSKSITLELVTDPTIGPVLGDADRLQQVIWNLLSNAVKFTPAKGKINVILQSSGTEAEIIVRDTGQGIHESFLPYVFDRFRQADGAITRQHGGLGLGLAIARHLVELHGGSIKAESDGENKGATFVVKLMMMPKPVEEPVRQEVEQT
ncbi:MAG TPA: MASE1 domain-containing protein [Pyrinomonadaceae bacterium]|nr:MASE1 domain-containing protein [Pyrinomonadaceae bacterium]